MFVVLRLYVLLHDTELLYMHAKGKDSKPRTLFAVMNSFYDTPRLNLSDHQ